MKIVSVCLLVFLWVGCNNHTTVKEKEIVTIPEKMDDQITDNIKAALNFAKQSNGNISNSIRLSYYPLVSSFYGEHGHKGVWSSMEKWNPAADSLFEFIKYSKYYGLYPQDYHFKELENLRKKIAEDSLVRKDAVAWTRADLMLSDAFIATLKDLAEGRIVPDSVSIISKENYRDSFFFNNLDTALQFGNVREIFDKVEPHNRFYTELRGALKDFVDSMDTLRYQYVDFPYTDTINFYKQLHQRLMQAGVTPEDTLSPDSVPDSVTMSKEIKDYQALHDLKIDGKAGEMTINALNLTDDEKFKRIAITLDRYKQLPELPERFVWVNIPGFYLQLWDHDTLILKSKVIVGKPTTQTPLLTSAISNMVIYPNWTIPTSIIKKEILPALKNDPGYLLRKGYNLVDYKGEVVDPFTVNWSKYKDWIPWKIVQGSGDDNALGILKFNFYNPYSVYLHDTNQRYLFANSNRALSHGCVRVQKWEQLAFYIAKNDNLNLRPGYRTAYNIDSLKTWIANKDRKTVMVRERLPLFIEYFTCVANDNKITFYNDVYYSDQDLGDKYFANK